VVCLECDLKISIMRRPRPTRTGGGGGTKKCLLLPVGLVMLIVYF
jgi:hypothetical protein